MKGRITPENITELKNNEIFVFGSNESGIHGAGAARLALEKFGAKMMSGFGKEGQSFAIPTKDYNIQTLSLEGIKYYVDQFIYETTLYPELTYFVTEVGCGLAGYEPKDIAPLFKDSVKYDNIHLPQRFWDVLINNL